jgi:hypothetical protein
VSSKVRERVVPTVTLGMTVSVFVAASAVPSKEKAAIASRIKMSRGF